VIKLLLLSLVFLSSLYANKVIYFSYDKVPQRVVKGEIFPVTLKSLSTVRDFTDIKYEFSNFKGLEILTPYPEREIKSKYFYDTFYMLSTSSSVKLPDVNATLIASDEYNSSFIKGEKLNTITLNPRKNFSNIIANDFQLQEYKTTSYDETKNIIVFVATATNSNIGAMHFTNVDKQGIESITDSYIDSKITYYIVVDKHLENFTFTYFNLLKNRFQTLSIPIIVDDDSVTTQSDLKPKDQSKERLKMLIAGAVAFVAFVFILFRKKYIYLVFLIIPLIYIAYIAMPEKEICIKKGSPIHLLPVDNGTIFETTTTTLRLQKEGEVENYVKVKLQNEKIGWVHNEDTCQN